jgi:hypothetical protein
MGVVHLAVRADAEYEQAVAIKILTRGMDTDAILHRFRTERQIRRAVPGRQSGGRHEAGSPGASTSSARSKHGRADR